jgi:hypothetical protein
MESTIKLIASIAASVFVAAGIALAAPAHADIDCGNLTVAGPDTSCEFALAVHDAFINSRVGQVIASSPATGQSYVMDCVQLRQRVECRGGDNAVVDLY